MKLKLSAPMPLVAARWIVGRRLHATHSGGWGFCIGLGTTLRTGISKNRPSYPANGSSTNMRVTASSASSHWSRFSSRSMRKPPSSALDDASPVPKSTRPSEIRSSVAMRSATRAVWLKLNGSWTMPWPSRMRDVRWLHAARNTSGADECEYSSRKWCSTSHT
jgi:hypothetical protein